MQLEAAGGGDYDVVIADDYIVEVAIAEGLVTELDKNEAGEYRQREPHLPRASSLTPRTLTPCPTARVLQTIVYDPLR